MELDNTWATIQDGWGNLMALAVTYSFSVLGAVVLIIAGYIAAGFVERAVGAGLGKIHGFDPTLRNFFSHLARYIVLGLVLIMVLGQFGVQTASIIAAIGAVGLAIGLALQGTLQNIAAGIMLLVLRPFRIGESIEVGSVAGDVEEIGLFATRLRAADGTYILAPNAKLWNEPVRNSTRNRQRRNDITLNISYSNDLERAQRQLVELAVGDARVSKQPAPIAFIGATSDASLGIVLRYWTSDKDFLKTRIDLTRLAIARFKASHILFAPASGMPATPEPEEEEEESRPPRDNRAGATPTRQ
jgi:small conductance mechanosensitive channel